MTSLSIQIFFQHLFLIIVPIDILSGTMKHLFILITLLSHSFNGLAQANIFESSDSSNISRSIAVSSISGGLWIGSMVGLSSLWYQDVPKSKFHTFDDSKNWLQMDKAGHFYTANKIALLTGNAFRWSGMDHKTSALLGTGISLGYQTTLEFLDAYSAEWGFSWSDVAANTLGAGFYLGQELLWREQHFLLKFSAHPTKFAALRPSVLGSNVAERVIKDYNGQTYWLSFNPCQFIENSKFPAWLCLSLGYSAHAKIFGDQDTYTDITGKTYHAQREFLVSLDVDFSRIPVKRTWLKTVLRQLNYVKIPFPALLLRNGQLIAAPIYF
jgi:hypothetical protein